MDQQIVLDILQYRWQNNTVQQYIIAALLFFLFFALFKVLEGVVLRRVEAVAQRTKTDIDDALVQIISSLKPPFYSFLAFFLSLRYLAIVGLAYQIVRVILVAWITYQVVVAVHILVDYVIKRRVTKVNTPNAQAVANIVHGIISIALWAFGVLFVLSNLGVNVTSLIAGLGVGGIAVALAAQNILGDLISSLAIYFDRPFVPGDVISVGDVSGTVQRVGIKTTRLRSLTGEEVIIPNRDISAARIKNFKRMSERRIEFDFGIINELSVDQLRSVPGLVRDVFGPIDDVRFGRAHVFTLDGDKVDVHVVYYVTAPAFTTYMDVNQQVLLGLKQTLEQQGMKLAYVKQEHV
jgi:small-conductance mechanosensitive channel